MNINTYINKYLLYLNYINQEVYKNNITYSTNTNYKYNTKFKSMQSTVTLTIWEQDISKDGSVKNNIIAKYKDLTKTKLLEILQKLVEELDN